MGEPRHFLDIDLCSAATLRGILELATAFKRRRPPKGEPRPLVGKTLAMLFEKQSTRTRLSFEVGMSQLGGDTIVLNTQDSQLGRGESIADTARVLSRYVDAIVLRTTSADKLHELADHSQVPVINGLTDKSHPCQVLADVMTFEEHRGPIRGRVVAWSGDGNNVAASWVHAAIRFDFVLRLACPAGLQPPEALLAWARKEGGTVSVTEDVETAVVDADCVVTDTWVSMGQTDGEFRHNLLQPYRVDERLMARAKPDAIFMHCLPARRDREVTAGVIDGPQSVVWDEAANRLHAQKGLLVWCLNGI